MTGDSVALDTNIISALLKGEETVALKIDGANEIYIPIVVLGELHYGAQHSTDFDKNISNINRIVERYNVLNTDDETAYLYGVIKARLKKKGKLFLKTIFGSQPLPNNMA